MVPIRLIAPISKDTLTNYHWIINFFNKEKYDDGLDYGIDFIKIVKEEIDNIREDLTPKFLKKEENLEEYSTLALFYSYYDLGEPNLSYLETRDMLDYYIDKENSMEFKVKRAHELFMKAYLDKFYSRGGIRGNK